MSDPKVMQCLTALKAGADSCESTFGVPSSFTIAQAALESSWMQSMLAVKANNLFGVKADASWTGDTLDMPTREYLKGQWVVVTAHWRKYSSIEECLKDHVRFFKQNPRYAKALQYPHDGIAFAREVANAGYATDPQYADKLIAVIRSHLLKDVGA
jgi:flagellum-specific peptidoglycan hydrolase FlgJ